MIAAVLVTGTPVLWAAEPAAGTIITNANWRQYQDYMTVTLQELMSGSHLWKMPPEGQIVVGPTVSVELPKKYLEDTEKYRNQVKLRRLPSGGYAVDGYVAGLPFPKVEGPDAGEQVYYNYYYRYAPRMTYQVGPYRLVDRFMHVSTQTTETMNFRFMHVSDPGHPTTLPGAGDIFYSDNNVVIEPEQSKYVNDLQIFYDDVTRMPETFVFLPSLRRSLRLSASARCAPLVGSDYLADDGVLAPPIWFESKLVATRKVLALMHMVDTYENTTNYYLPLFFPKPAVGKWELRDVYVIELRRVSEFATGYCYSKIRFYVDRETFNIVGAEDYDTSGNLWKMFVWAYHPAPIPGTNDVTVGTTTGIMTDALDIQSGHATEGYSKDATVNENVPARYQDAVRWGTPAGMLQVMQ
jgi:hypothetical protein